MLGFSMCCCCDMVQACASSVFTGWVKCLILGVGMRELRVLQPGWKATVKSLEG